MTIEDFSKYIKREKPIVYFGIIKQLECVKIGTTIDFESRKKTLESIIPCDIIFYCIKFPSKSSACKAEKLLHKKYARYNIKAEWFELNTELLCEITKSNSTKA